MASAIMPSPGFLPRPDSEMSGVPSESTLGPSPSERLVALASTESGPEATSDDEPLEYYDPLPLANDVGHGSTIPDDDTSSLLTETLTITRVDELPANKKQAIGTVLEEEKPRRVPLVIEYLGNSVAETQATRLFVNELYDADLELCLECQFLPKVDVFSNSDPFAEVFQRDNSRGQWRLIGRTETLVNSHFPRFVKKFPVTAQPDHDMEKEILIKIFAKGSIQRAVRLGEASCTLWDIVSAPGQCKVLKMNSIDPKKDTWVIVTGDASRNKMHELNPRSVTVHVKFDKTARPRSKMHFVICRALKKGRWTPVYRSEGHVHPDRDFVPATVTFADMFCGDESKPARVEFFQKRAGVDPKLSGFVQFSVRQLEMMEDDMVMQWWSGQDAVAPGMIKMTKKEISAQSISISLTMFNE